MFPYVLIVTDGTVIRTIHKAALPADDVVALEDIILRAVRPPTPPSPRNFAQQLGYEGDMCTNCGGFKMKRSGHCLVCDDCGTTTGCS